jgi:hypothetical protein
VSRKPIICSQFKYNAEKRNTLPKEKLKPQEDGIEKSAQNKVVPIKNTEFSLPKCPVKHLCTSRPAGREIDRASTRR